MCHTSGRTKTPSFFLFFSFLCLLVLEELHILLHESPVPPVMAAYLHPLLPCERGENQIKMCVHALNVFAVLS